jgi:hypothetical protein
MSNSKLSVEQVARPLLAAIIILIYWACAPEADATTSLGGEIRHYTLPCYEQLRSEHPEIPRGDENPGAYLAWHSDPANRVERNEYLAAVRDCRAGHEAAHGKWNVDSMILVAVER